MRSELLGPVDVRARQRIRRRILPYLFFLYVIAYLDRVNVSYAALQMTGALGLTPDQFGFGVGIFFWGYFLLEIPGTILVEKWSARKWMARIMISWGLIAMIMGFIHTPRQFYWARFLLGAAEAGFFPGMVVYLSHWFRSEDRARAMAFFMAAQPISNMLGSPISGLLLGLNWLGLAGWRWLFVIEGIPAVIFGVVTLFYLTDWPREAGWLQQDERHWIITELEREKQAKLRDHSYSAWHALRQPTVILLVIAYFCMNMSIYGVSFWLPTILKKLSGFPDLVITLVTSLPYCVGLIAILLIGWSSDKTRERRWHTALPILALSIGLALSVTVVNSIPLTIAMFSIAAIGMYGYIPCFWSLPTSFLTGTAAAACIGLINSIGNLGGFVGPFVVGDLVKRTHSFAAGILFLSLSALIAAGLILSMRLTKQRTAVTAEAHA